MFEKQYETTKTSYVKELPEYGTVEADVNGDGKKEAISYEVARDEYGTGGAITVTCGVVSFSTASLIDQDYGASGGYSSEGYVIHTEDEKTYLYLQHQSDNDSHYINVFDLTTGTPYLCGLYWKQLVRSPITDPDSFPLWDRLDVLGTYSAYKEYHVGADGIPETDDTLVSPWRHEPRKSDHTGVHPGSGGDCSGIRIGKAGNHAGRHFLHDYRNRWRKLCGGESEQWTYLSYSGNQRRGWLGVENSWCQRV